MYQNNGMSTSETLRSEQTASEPQAEVPAGAPAPYGRTCLNCAKSKCKCISRGIGNSCERCHRLKKECMPSVTSRKKHAKRAPGSKTLQLEKKLDSIVLLLKNGTHGAATGPSPTAAILDAVSEYCGPMIDENSPENLLQEPLSSFPPHISIQGPAQLSPCKAEEYLQIFRTQKLKNLPFLYIPITTSAGQLLQERPFLWHCIMALSTKSTAQQQSLSTKVRQILGQRMIVQSEFDLDLLLGILTFITWANCQILKKPALSMFTQLAISLVFELGLNKPPGGPPSTLFPPETECSPLPRVRTMEERRAVLGTFLVSSVVSSFLQRIDTLRWTSHMDECLQVLDENKECPADQILVQQIRLQLIVEKAAQVSPNNRAGLPVPSIVVPSTLYLRSLKVPLQGIKEKLSPELQSNSTVQLHIISTALCINEFGSSKGEAMTDCADFQRLESLYESLSLTKAWFDIFLTITPIDYIGMSFCIFSQLTNCLVLLFKLSTLNDPAWDKNFVRTTLDILLILDQIILSHRQAHWDAALTNDSSDETIFNNASDAFVALKMRWEAVLAESPTCSNSFPSQDFENLTSEASDESWFSEVFASWDVF